MEILSQHVSHRDLRVETTQLPLQCRMTFVHWNGQMAPLTYSKMGSPTGNSLRQPADLPHNFPAFATCPCHPSCIVPIVLYPPRLVTWYVVVSMKRLLQSVQIVKYWHAIVMETWNPSVPQPQSPHRLLYRQHQPLYQQQWPLH